jgi:hypothetical protein
MAISSVSNANPLDQLARSLVDRFDANKDGQLTTEEFTSFLSNFLNTATNGKALGVTSGTATKAVANGTAPMTGFDLGKLADTSHDTLKYRFGRVAQNYGLDSVTDKSKAEALLNSMKADLVANGVDVLAIEKDKIQVTDDSGKSVWIDVIRGAGGGPNKAWQWMVAD